MEFTNLQVKKASLKEDIRFCLDKSIEIFDARLSSDYKWHIWEFFPNYDVFLVVNDNKILGFLRCLYLECEVGGMSYSTGCLTSIAVLPKYRGNGLSKILIEGVIEKIKKNVDLVYLIARKSADYYYTKFGFLGLSNYPRVKLKPGCQYSRGEVTFRDAELADVEFLDSCYENSYKKKSGIYFKRTNDFWYFSLNRVIKLENFFFKIMICQNQKIGYVLFDEATDTVLELGFTENKMFDSTSCDLSFFESKEIQVNLDHPLFFHLPFLRDIEYTTRQCTFGGHMFLIISDCTFLNSALKKQFNESSYFARSPIYIPFFNQL